LKTRLSSLFFFSDLPVPGGVTRPSFLTPSCAHRSTNPLIPPSFLGTPRCRSRCFSPSSRVTISDSILPLRQGRRISFSLGTAFSAHYWPPLHPGSGSGTPNGRPPPTSVEIEICGHQIFFSFLDATFFLLKSHRVIPPMPTVGAIDLLRLLFLTVTGRGFGSCIFFFLSRTPSPLSFWVGKTLIFCRLRVT